METFLMNASPPDTNSDNLVPQPQCDEDTPLAGTFHCVINDKHYKHVVIVGRGTVLPAAGAAGAPSQLTYRSQPTPTSQCETFHTLKSIFSFGIPKSK